MNRKLFVMEVLGGAFIAVASHFMSRLYALCDGELLGILFGSVNGSAWESCKTLLLPYLLWAVLEVLTLRLRVHRFAVVKTASLYALGLSYLGFRSMEMNPAAAGVICTAAALAMSCLLYCSPLPLRWLFAPSLVLLFLFTALYFSLTPFPPHTPLFFDAATGMYGIIPRSFDYGAAALNTVASCQKLSP